MTVKASFKRALGIGADDGESSDKNFSKGTFSRSAARARDAFLRHKKKKPKVKTLEQMTPLQRRMQSGSI